MLINIPESLEKAPTEKTPGAHALVIDSISRAADALEPDSSSTVGQDSTALLLAPCIRIFVSPCARDEMVGILQCSAFSWACNSRPNPDMRISAIRHAACCCWPEFRMPSVTQTLVTAVHGFSCPACYAHQLIVIDNRDHFFLRLNSHGSNLSLVDDGRNHALV